MGRVRADRPGTVLDHVAVGTSGLADGWELFGGLLGGTWAYGGNSPGFWWGQLQFSGGPKVELLTPTGGPDAAFLERFLADRGPGVHHLNFIVADLETTLRKITALGIEPVRVSLQNPAWKEAFLRPADGYGTVIQIAEQAGPPPPSSPPAGLGEPGPSCSLRLIEQHVADIDGATRLVADALDGTVVSRHDNVAGSVADVVWPNQARLRLVQPAGDRDTRTRSAVGIASVQFGRDYGEFSEADVATAGVLAGRLGVTTRLGGLPGRSAEPAAR